MCSAPTAQAAVAQFTCFTSTKVLALLVQKYAPAMCSALLRKQQVQFLLALLVQKYWLY